MDPLSVTLPWIKLSTMVGPYIVFALLVYILRMFDERRMDRAANQMDTWIKTQQQQREADDKTRERDRQEHMDKWNTLTKTHKEEQDRLMHFYERLVGAFEKQTVLLDRLDQRVETNQFCPITREAHGR